MERSPPPPARSTSTDNSGNVTIGATLTTSGAAARSVEVTLRDGGTVDINGLVTDTSHGINLSTNGTGLVRFDGGITAIDRSQPCVQCPP